MDARHILEMRSNFKNKIQFFNLLNNEIHDSYMYFRDEL